MFSSCSDLCYGCNETQVYKLIDEGQSHGSCEAHIGQIHLQHHIQCVHCETMIEKKSKTPEVCIYCQKNPQSVFLPCFHFLCSNCFNTLNKKCPFCSTSYKTSKIPNQTHSAYLETINHQISLPVLKKEILRPLLEEYLKLIENSSNMIRVGWKKTCKLCKDSNIVLTHDCNHSFCLNCLENFPEIRSRCLVCERIPGQTCAKCKSENVIFQQECLHSFCFECFILLKEYGDTSFCVVCQEQNELQKYKSKLPLIKTIEKFCFKCEEYRNCKRKKGTVVKCTTCDFEFCFMCGKKNRFSSLHECEKFYVDKKEIAGLEEQVEEMNNNSTNYDIKFLLCYQCFTVTQTLRCEPYPECSNPRCKKRLKK